MMFLVLQKVHKVRKVHPLPYKQNLIKEDYEMSFYKGR